ncbi:MAG: ATP-binding protein [Pirellulaceae bacterium]|jgi:signal transduction histidine kinase|nr:ATP-binding protein [Pirellulaceae bacterium]
MTEEERYQRLLERYEELATLAGSLAHEINNPLSVIRMNVDLLAEDLAETHTPENQRALTKLEIVHNQCSRLENLLSSFMRFAKVKPLDLRPGSLNQIVEQVVRLYDPLCAQDNIEVVRYLDPDLPSIRLDAETLHAALLNLVKNALEAMESGGQLTVRTYPTPTGVALDLIDTGEGMDNETALNMFKEFYTTKQGGSGLGLPTARKVIEAHDGRIAVQSEVGRGTKITLEFPAPARLS